MPVRYFKDGDPPHIALYRSGRGKDVEADMLGEAYFDRRTMDWADPGSHSGRSIYTNEYDEITPEEAAAIEALLRAEQSRPPNALRDVPE